MNKTLKITLPYKFSPREYQVSVLRDVGSSPTQKKRGVCVWHRRSGKDKTYINLMAKEAMKRKGTYLYLLPKLKQSRKIIWKGMDRDGFKFIDHIPEQLVVGKNDTEMSVELKNGSVIMLGGTDALNIDGWIGTNPVGIIFSEYSLQNPMAWDYLRPILTENGGWALFNFTPRGQNHAWELYEMAKLNPEWFCQLLSVDETKRPDGTPVISTKMIQSDVGAGMDADLVKQEYYCSFTAATKGAYYGKEMEKAEEEDRIHNLPYDSASPVWTSWDIGVGDSTAIWFYQRSGPWFHYIDYYETSGEGVQHYAKVLKDKSDKGQWVYRDHFAPHDIQVRDWSADGKSRFEVAKAHGIKFITVPRHSIDDRIEAVRSHLSKCRFDEEKCQQGVRALKSYQKKYDEERNIFQNRPQHDWSTHGADSFGYGVMGHREIKPMDKVRRFFVDLQTADNWAC